MNKPHDDEIDYPPIGSLPRLPGGWRFEGRKIVYDGPDVDLWAKLLTDCGELPN